MMSKAMPHPFNRICYLMHMSCMDVYQIYIYSEGDLERLVRVHNWLIANKNLGVKFEEPDGNRGWCGFIHIEKESPPRQPDGTANPVNFDKYWDSERIAIEINRKFPEYFDEQKPQSWVKEKFPEFFPK